LAARNSVLRSIQWIATATVTAAIAPLPTSAPSARQVAVRAEDPRGVGHTGPLPGPPGEHQHVRLRIHPHDRPYPRGERQAQLAGAAAQVHHKIVAGQRERFHHRIDRGGGVSPPVPCVVGGHLTVEHTSHAGSLPRDAPVAPAIPLTA
jgi:hypothetical protein